MPVMQTHLENFIPFFITNYIITPIHFTSLPHKHRKTLSRMHFSIFGNTHLSVLTILPGLNLISTLSFAMTFFLVAARIELLKQTAQTTFTKKIFTSHSLQNPKSLQSSPPPLICYLPIVPASSIYSLKAGISAKSLNKPDYLSVLSTQKKTKPYLFSVKNSKKKHSLSSSTFYLNSIIILLHIRVKY